MRHGFAGIIVASMLFGCGKSAPECSGVDVIKVAEQVVMEQRNKGIEGQDLLTGAERLLKESMKVLGQENLTKGKEKISSIALADIRTDKVDAQAKRVTCLANATAYRKTGKGETFPVSYDAQFTDDGKIYVTAK